MTPGNLRIPAHQPHSPTRATETSGGPSGKSCSSPGTTCTKNRRNLGRRLGRYRADAEPHDPATHCGIRASKVDQISPDVAWVPPQDVVGKVGFPTAVGWVAHAVSGTADRFAVPPGPCRQVPR